MLMPLNSRANWAHCQPEFTDLATAPQASAADGRSEVAACAAPDRDIARVMARTAANER